MCTLTHLKARAHIKKFKKFGIPLFLAEMFAASFLEQQLHVKISASDHCNAILKFMQQAKSVSGASEIIW